MLLSLGCCFESLFQFETIYHVWSNRYRVLKNSLDLCMRALYFYISANNLAL